VDDLSHADKVHLDAAEGWLLLDRPDYALEEFGHLTASCRENADVLEREWQTHAMGRNWTAAYETAVRLVNRHPKSAFGWIHRSYALRRMEGGGLMKAREALLPAAARFPKELLIPYNLACYAACLDRLDEAWDWLQAATQIAGATRVRRMALGDQDLAPLHDRVREALKG
jgi:hypothetical protein